MEVKLGLKSQKKSINELLICWLFFEPLLETKIVPNHTKMEAKIDSKTLSKGFPRGLEAKVVKV